MEYLQTTTLSMRSLTMIQLRRRWLYIFLAYVNGYTDGDFARNYLIPLPVSNRQVAHVVGKWIQAHPEKWHFSYVSCVHLSLLETWPNPYN